MGNEKQMKCWESKWGQVQVELEMVWIRKVTLRSIQPSTHCSYHSSIISWHASQVQYYHEQKSKNVRVTQTLQTFKMHKHVTTVAEQSKMTCFG